jgi:hypothetical protein
MSAAWRGSGAIVPATHCGGQYGIRTKLLGSQAVAITPKRETADVEVSCLFVIVSWLAYPVNISVSGEVVHLG